jgi:sugar phosphate permease
MFRIITISVYIIAACLFSLSCGKDNPTDSGSTPVGTLSEHPDWSNQADTEENSCDKKRE